VSLLNNTPKPRICLDANVLFSAAFSETGGARMLFRLAESKAIQILISPSALSEADKALRRKAPHALGHLAILLDKANSQIVDNAAWTEVEAWNEIVDYVPDAIVIAEAVTAGADYLVTLDRQHVLDNRQLARALPFPIGTPGDCLAWLRTSLISPYDDSPNDSPAIRDHRLNEPLAAYRTRERS
jgi:predicted nucleic acid-binding protein